MINSLSRITIALSLLLFVAGCNIVAVATDRLAKSVTIGILNQDDPATVRDGAPAYLLLIGGLIQDNPNNINLLMAGARLYSSYASVFVDDKKRTIGMSNRAWKYSQRALCQRYANACDIHKQPYEKYAAFIASTKPADVPLLYTYAVSWAGWIQVNREDMNAIANIPKVKVTMHRVVELDDDYDGGIAHMYLGVLAALLPPSLGGKPKQARAHFEKALLLSRGRNLMAKVLFAERYARLVFNRKLHDRLLHEVIKADPNTPNLTLMNILAKQKAKVLLKSSNDYF